MLIASIHFSVSVPKNHLMWDIYPTTLNSIQGDSGEKSFFGGENIGHFEEKCSNQCVCNSEWQSRWNCLNLEIQKHCEW